MGLGGGRSVRHRPGERGKGLRGALSQLEPRVLGSLPFSTANAGQLPGLPLPVAGLVGGSSGGASDTRLESLFPTCLLCCMGQEAAHCWFCCLICQEVVIVLAPRTDTGLKVIYLFSDYDYAPPLC